MNASDERDSSKTRETRLPGSHPVAAPNDSKGLEWESDFVSADMGSDGSEYSRFVNPVPEPSDSRMNQLDGDEQK